MNFVLVEDQPAAAAQAGAAQICATSAVAQGAPRADGSSRAAAEAPPMRRSRNVGDAVSALSIAKPLATSINASDRRWALRKRTDMPGFIAHSKNPQGIRCIVRNTSSSGALVEVVSGSDRFANPADEIPDRITLVFISYKERTEVACAVMRRAGRNMLGVRYVGPFRSFPAPHAAAKPGTAPKKR